MFQLLFLFGHKPKFNIDNLILLLHFVFKNILSFFFSAVQIDFDSIQRFCKGIKMST